MKNPISADIKNHLEFLGFVIEATEANSDTDELFCKHPTRSKFIVRIIKDFVLLLSSYETKPIPESLQLFKLFDEIHRTVLVTRWHTRPTENNPNLVVTIEAYAFGYEKIAFGALMEQYQKEISDFMSKFNDFDESKPSN